MDLIQIKKLLHHREPYLMVSQVDEIDKEFIECSKVFTGKEFFIAGHFPGAPVVPGAMLQEFCTQSAGILLTKFYSGVTDYDSEKTKGHAIGVLNKVEYAKYLEIVKPEKPIQCKVKLLEQNGILFKFAAKVFQDNKLKAKLRFNLVNISDEYLFN